MLIQNQSKKKLLPNHLSLFFKIKHKAQGTLSRVLPADAYIFFYSFLGRNWTLNQLKKSNLNISIVKQSVKFKNLIFRNDLGNAAGLDKDGELLPFNYALGSGFAIVGTVLDHSHKGNLFSFGPWQTLKTNVWTPLPHSNSAINSFGLPSKGIDMALKNINRFKRDYRPVDFPIGISLMAHPQEESEQQINGVKTSIQKSAGIIDFIELNESCPNVEHSQDQDQGNFYERLLAYVTCRNRYAPGTPLMVKVKNAENQKLLLKIIHELKIDGLVCFNSQTNYTKLRNNLADKDQRLFDYYTKKYRGGVSGKIIYQQNFQELKKIKKEIDAAQLNIPLVHVGGISSFSDIKQSRKVAFLRQWYTGLMEKIIREKIEDIYPTTLNETLN